MTMLIPFAGLVPDALEERRRQHDRDRRVPAGRRLRGFRLARQPGDDRRRRRRSRVFPGVERTLALVDGHGMTLDIDGEPILLSQAEPVAAFDGEVAGRGQAESRPQHRLQRDDPRWTAATTASAGAGWTARRGSSRAPTSPCCSWPKATASNCAATTSASTWCATTPCVLDPGTTWKLEAGQGTIFVVDIHYYDDEDDLEDERRRHD